MRRKILQYEPKLKQLARNLRNSGTPGEAILWNQLKSKKIKGYKFRRQVQIGNYIVDFFCPALMLVDGVVFYIEEWMDGFEKKKE